MTAPESRSNSGLDANARGIVVLVVAVLIGVLLLSKAGDGGGGTQKISSGNGADTTTTTSGTPLDSGTTTTSGGGTSGEAHQPGDVKVLVLNGSGKTGAARANSESLGTAGYDMLTPGDALQNISATIVYFAEGYEEDAKTVATTLGKETSVVQSKPATSLGVGSDTANVVVVLGSSDTSPASSTTSTPSVTTTTG